MQYVEKSGYDTFIEIFDYINEIEADIYMSDLFKVLCTRHHKTDISDVVYSLKSIGYEVRVCNKTGMKLLVIPKVNKKGNCEYFERIKEPEAVINFFDSCLINQSVASIELKESKTHVFDIYPHNILFIDEELSLIYEKCKNGALEVVPLREINYFCKQNYEHTANYSDQEVDIFINEIRAVSGNEARVIIKMKRPRRILPSHKYQYIKGEKVVTNQSGEHYWSGTVELSTPFLEWLSTIKKDIEIISPTSLNEVLIDYVKLS